jgi:hypothetical protein
MAISSGGGINLYQVVAAYLASWYQRYRATAASWRTRNIGGNNHIALTSRGDRGARGISWRVAHRVTLAIFLASSSMEACGGIWRHAGESAIYLAAAAMKICLKASGRGEN